MEGRREKEGGRDGGRGRGREVERRRAGEEVREGVLWW